MEKPRTEEEHKELIKKLRSRNNNGRWRKKRSDTGKKRKTYNRSRSSLYYWRCGICEAVVGTFWNRVPSHCYYIPMKYLGFGKREDFIKEEVTEEQ